MLSVLLVGAALARPYYGVSLGPAVLTGDRFFSAAPMGQIDLDWHLGPFQTWAGLGGSGLLAYTYEGVMPASAISLQAGLGFGSRTFSAGFYGGVGWPGDQVGLYSRLMIPTNGRVGRVGVEGRLFGTEVGEAGGLAVMLRVEPGRERARLPPPSPRRPPPPRHGPPPPPPPEDGPHHDDPYADPAGDDHHDSPYEDGGPA